jgi:hypothetical protein
VVRFLTLEGLDVEGHFTAKLEKVRAAVERDDFRSPDLKKLEGPLHRVKLDDASRLLVRFVDFQGMRTCLALEVIPQHAYDKSRFLRGARFDEAALALAETPERPEAAPMRFVHPTRATFVHLDKPLSFDDAQDEVLRRPLPMVLVGSAGSGKTALIVQRLRQHTGRVAYVTESAWLAQSARSLFVSGGFDADDTEADFLSYQQLLESVEIPLGRPATFRDFSLFFERHRQRAKFADPHQCFEEFRGVLTAEPEGPLTREAYLELGVRQSIFAPPQREQLWPVFEAWRGELGERGLYEPNLVAHRWLEKMTPRYDVVAVDEVQDLTNAQLALVLRALKPEGAFLIAGDANQVVHPNFFAWSKVKSLFWRGVGFDEARSVAMLQVSYRNSLTVTAAANRVLKLKHARFGSVDKESTSLMRTADCPEGSVVGFSLGSKAIAELDEKTRRSAKVAVVVLRDEHKAAAREHFRTPLVFSVLETKGLEYDSVILYRLVSSERKTFAELCEGVTRAELEVEALDYRRAKDKGDRSLEAFKFFVNALYVALTRAVTNVYLVEDDPSHPLLTLLDVPFDGGTGAVTAQVATVEDWQREAHRLEQHGKQEQLDAIRRTVLAVKPVPWKVLDRAGLDALAKVALDISGVSAKARQTLQDFALFHREELVLTRLRELSAARGTPDAAPVLRRALEGYEGKNFKQVLWNVDTWGVDFRSPQNLTPLMLAAFAGNRPLVEALLERGADLDARDHCGRAAVHWALRRALWQPGFAAERLGPVYDLVAPASFDLKVEGRLVQIGREQGEYFYVQQLIARFAGLFEYTWGRTAGVTSGFLQGKELDAFPDIVVAERRRKRTYLNHLLARNEVQSTYPSSRRLWVRERHGHYLPNPALEVRVREAWVPVLQLLGVDWHRSHLLPGVQ